MAIAIVETVQISGKNSRRLERSTSDDGAESMLLTEDE